MPRHFGNFGHPQNSVPALSPFLLNRLTIGSSHLGHKGVSSSFTTGDFSLSPPTVSILITPLHLGKSEQP